MFGCAIRMAFDRRMAFWARRSPHARAPYSRVARGASSRGGARVAVRWGWQTEPRALTRLPLPPPAFRPRRPSHAEKGSAQPCAGADSLARIALAPRVDTPLVCALLGCFLPAKNCRFLKIFGQGMPGLSARARVSEKSNWEILRGNIARMSVK